MRNKVINVNIKDKSTITSLFKMPLATGPSTSKGKVNRLFPKVDGSLLKKKEFDLSSGSE